MGRLAVGALIGVLTPIAVFLFDRVLRWDDPTAALATHGVGGAVGLVAIGILANGRTGVGWNGIGAEEYLGVARPGRHRTAGRGGVPPRCARPASGAASRRRRLVLFGFFAAWLFLAPLATAGHLLKPKMQATAGTPSEVASESAEPSVSVPVGAEPAVEPESLEPEPRVIASIAPELLLRA